MKKIHFIWQDWMVISGIAMNAGARVATNLVVASLSHLTQAASAIESNPAAQAASLNIYLTFIGFAVVIGFMLAYYLSIRKSRKTNEISKFFFNGFTFVFFIFLFFDFLNDVSVLAGVLLS